MGIEIQKDKDYTFTWKKYIDAIQIVPTSATVSIFDKGGTSVQTGSGSIDSEGTITYTLTAANNDTDDINFKCVLSYVYNSITTEEVQLFDVVLYPLRNNVTDTDLYVYLPELRKDIFETQGETDNAGTLSTLQDDMLKSDDRDLTGGKVEIFVSNTKVHEANITAYSKSTGTITFSPSYSTTISANLKYIVRDSYSTLIDKAFDRFVMKDVRQRRKPAAGYIDSNIVNELTTYKTLELYSFSAMEEEGDKWDLRYKKFRNMYNDELQKINEPYDDDADGNISDGEDDDSISYYSRKIQR